MDNGFGVTTIGYTSLVTWLECKVLIACTLQLLGQVAISLDKVFTISEVFSWCDCSFRTKHLLTVIPIELNPHKF